MVSLEQKLIKAELIQRREEGCQLEDIEPRISDALERKASDEEFHALYEELMALPIPESSAYIEPSTLEQIHAQRPWTAGSTATWTMINSITESTVPG